MRLGNQGKDKEAHSGEALALVLVRDHCLLGLWETGGTSFISSTPPHQ